MNLIAQSIRDAAISKYLMDPWAAGCVVNALTRGDRFSIQAANFDDEWRTFLLIVAEALS